ncbi:hypothetical protein GYMLUDRAFT_46090 [Collybiopsis luxurians FD-317 M1]|uniref:Uncharacterized protein n=1 Tax=Collybiopsis luxurians FD-317 M1 TaxID=944289 RepID=A0A0D0CQ59_9AGAR|nr:hypothetical protein GYMLUDRAFT_46090 [Collybiopsis luxurians FD-317 M1]
MPALSNWNNEPDVLVVGAGFSGIYVLHHLRKLGYSVQVFEAAPQLGGVWHWNAYPGARVDSENPHYALSIPEIWEGWSWKERFPGQKELREYFEYIDQKLDVKKNISFNTRVVAAHFDVETSRWVVKTEDGRVARPQFFILCVGFASKPYTPDFKGLDKFEGICHHTSQWPQEGVDLTNKRVGVIGTGASAVQVIQEIGPHVSHLTVFQRTPNYALAMGQRKLDVERERKRKVLYPTIFRRQFQTPTGFDIEPVAKTLSASTPEERLLHWEDAWARGGFAFLLNNYKDLMLDENTNREVYNFWRDKVRARLHDPRMQEKLAPTIAIHPLGAKRPCLEQTYYEVFNQPNVTLVDLNECGISEITSKGLLTEDGFEHEFDALVLATGFDSLTGSLTQIDIRGIDGVSIAEKWANGVYTNLGMTCANFPNMFFPYNAQAPTAFCNGPSCIEAQGNWIVDCIKSMKENNLTAICSTSEAEADWRAQVMGIGDLTLYSKAKSWYMGSNIPGKTVEHLNYAGGLHTYCNIITEIAEKGYEGFRLYRAGEKVSLAA